ncbi:MAG: autotransporter outer membrane beta-barrel domain-containing protein, partial [Parachlamydiaceae bacterium]|nr:autotransporter outer membrane beta-barrel domain-containing protein [Parachlamydiaceae bacterium]
MILALTCFTSISLSGEIRGKVDAGPTLIYLDLLKSGKTEDTKKMGGFKADSTVLVYEGIAIKPSLLMGWGDGKLVSGSIAAGYYIPLPGGWCNILPNVGIGWSYLDTRTKLDVNGIELKDLRQRMRSESPFIGIDFSFCINKQWSIIGAYQYIWAHSDTQINEFPDEFQQLTNIKRIRDKSHSCGPNYSLGIEYSYNDQWAFNLGFGYNISLSKEKHGIRGKGVKLGVGYYF